LSSAISTRQRAGTKIDNPACENASSKIFEDILVRIEENPRLYQKIHRAIGRAPLRDFPYGVYYVQIGDEIRVLAVTHDARHPSVWRRRR
jgi:plasmid stabilization system protein ParE